MCMAFVFSGSVAPRIGTRLLEPWGAACMGLRSDVGLRDLGLRVEATLERA